MRRIGMAILALALVAPAWASDRDDGRKSMRVAQSLVEWGDCNEAIPWLEEALDRDPGLCEAYYHLARCLMEDPELEGGRQVRGAVASFEDCATPEQDAQVAELRAVVPDTQERRRTEDAVSDRGSSGTREAREVRRPEDREDRDEVRQERSGRRERQGRDYWKKSDRREDDDRREREERVREDEERRDREERAREEEERREEQEVRKREAREREAREQEIREREAREREDREREDREREAREREAREADEEDLLTEIVIEDGDDVEPTRERRSGGRRAATLPDLDDEEEERPGLRRKDREQRDPWEDDEEWKDPYLDD